MKKLFPYIFSILLALGLNQALAQDILYIDPTISDTILTPTEYTIYDTIQPIEPSDELIITYPDQTPTDTTGTDNQEPDPTREPASTSNTPTTEEPNRDTTTDPEPEPLDEEYLIEIISGGSEKEKAPETAPEPVPEPIPEPREPETPTEPENPAPTREMAPKPIPEIRRVEPTPPAPRNTPSEPAEPIEQTEVFQGLLTIEEKTATPPPKQFKTIQVIPSLPIKLFTAVIFFSLACFLIYAYLTQTKQNQHKTYRKVKSSKADHKAKTYHNALEELILNKKLSIKTKAQLQIDGSKEVIENIDNPKKLIQIIKKETSN